PPCLLLQLSPFFIPSIVINAYRLNIHCYCIIMASVPCIINMHTIAPIFDGFVLQSEIFLLEFFKTVTHIKLPIDVSIRQKRNNDDAIFGDVGEDKLFQKHDADTYVLRSM